MTKGRAHVPVWDNDSELWRCETCGKPATTRAKLTTGKNTCRGKRGKVMVHTEGEYAIDGHRLWTLGDWVCCTKCGAYAN